MSVFKKNEEITLSREAASQMLSNVFEACDSEANRVPLEVLASYSHYRKERHLLQKIVLAVVLLAFLLLPVLFVTADVEVSFVSDSLPGSPVVQVITQGLLPVQRVTATVGGHPLQVYEVAENTYQVYPDRNGTLKVEVTLANKQYTQVYQEITTVDVTPPQLVSSSLEGEELTIFLTDDSGRLNFEEIYAVDSQGGTVCPLGYDEQALSVTFAYPDTFLNIFVPDLCGNTLQLVLTTE